MNEHISPFLVPFPDMPQIDGVKISTVETGMRYKNRDDLMLMEFCEGTNVAGVFTKNKMPGEPIKWCKKILPNGIARALIVNAGVANVFTGSDGYNDVEKTARAVAETLGCDEEEVYVSSTGVIGEPLETEKIIENINDLKNSLSSSSDMWSKAAKAILTTDTFHKGITRTAYIGAEQVTINGFIKGSGMIEPDMATMLGYIVTDANIPAEIMQKWLNEDVEISYNSMTVDSDTSTSDTVLFFATGKKEHWDVTGINDPAWFDFKEKLKEINIEMAKMVARDGEGITKFITIDISGAESNNAARKIGKSIANSPLVKCAVAGEDPNWGRITMAIGKSGEKIDQKLTQIWIGDNLIAENSHVHPNYDEEQTAQYMKNSEISIKVDVGIGTGQATVWTMDLTYEYIRINVDYRS